MARLFDTETKQPVEVPDADAPAHVLSGRYGLEAGKEVLLTRPDGTTVAVPAESAPQAFEQGYKFTSQGPLRSEELEQQFGAVGGKLLAAGTGAARGLSLGLSDRALRNLGVEAGTLRTAQEGAPITSTATQVVGAVAPMVLSGGSGAAAEGAGAVGALPNAVAGLGSMAGKGAVSALGLGGKSLLARAGAKALKMGVSGAVEGSLYGAGQAVTEDALGRADLNAESLLANAGLGAVVGFGSGAILGGGGVLAGAGLRKVATAAKDHLGGGSIKEFLEGFAGERALKATLGQQKRAFTQLEEKGLADKAKKYLLDDIGIAATDTTESIAEKLAAKRDAVGGQLDDLVTKLDTATEGTPLKRLSPLQIAKRVEEEVAQPLKKLAANQAEYKSVMDEVENIRALGNKGMPFAEARAQRAAVQDKINYDVRNGLTVAADAKNKIARIWNDVIDEHAEPVLKTMGEQVEGLYRKTRDEFSLVQRLTDYAENRVQGNAANRFVSPSDYGTGIGAGMLTGDPLTGAAAAVGHKVLRERGNAFAANIAHKLSKLKFIARASEAVTKRMDTALERILTGRHRGPSGQFVRPGPSIVRPAAMQLMINSPLMPGGSGARPANRRVAAKQRAQEIAALMADPSRAADRIAASTAGLDDAAPNITTQAVTTATKALQYLHANAPKNPRSVNTMQPLLDEWEPSDQEAARFDRRLRAAFDPMSVIEDLANGTLSKEGAETLKELYPQLHQMTFERLTERLAESKDKLPYEDRINLSILFGVPVDDSMRPDFIRRSQEGWAQKPSEGQGGGGQRVAGLDKLGMADNMRTETQKREATR